MQPTKMIALCSPCNRANSAVDVFGCAKNHANRAWGGASDDGDACYCGVPCPACNPSDREHKPKMPEGYRTTFDKQGWKH